MDPPSDFVEGERRWAAVLFADMAAFTSATEALGAEAVYHLVRKIIPLASASIESHGGYVLEYAGDSVLAIFGAPIALENASLKACEAALALQRVIGAQTHAFARDFGIAPRFRIGIGGGEVVLGRMGLEKKLDLKVTGEPVNLAARLQTLAGEGEIWISDSVFQQVEGFVDASDLGSHAIKGLGDAQRLYRLECLSGRETKFAGLQRRGTVQLVGRAAEWERLTAAVRTAATALRVVSLSGPPGIGKSRLAHELLAQGRFEAIVRVVQCNPESSGIALKPFLDFLRAAAAIGGDDAPSERRRKLADLLTGLGITSETQLALLWDLLDPAAAGAPSSDDYQRAAATRDLICEIMVASCRRRPHVLVIEDGHWIDRVTEELIHMMLERHADARLALILTHRSHYAPAWLRSRSVTSITLQPLSSAASSAMVAGHLGADQVPAELAALIERRAEGNPLFVEETLRFLRASGNITFGDGGIRFVAPKVDRSMPGNLQHLIMNRVDTLPADQRALLQLASVFGRHFLSDALERVARFGVPVAAAISVFVLQELVEPDPGLGGKGFRFKHALMRDALYESILSTNRRAMHERIARDLEASAADRLGEVAEVLAYHYAEGHATDKAVEYLWQSALKSIKIYSLAEADRQLSEAARVISKHTNAVSEQRYGEIVSAWLRVAHQSGNYTRVREVAAQVLPRLRAAGPSIALSQALTYLALAYVNQRDYRTANKLADEAQLLAELLGNPLALAWSKLAHMRIYEETDWKGRDALIQLAGAIAPIAEKCNDNQLGLIVRFVVAASFYSQGLSRKAREAAGELIRFGEVHGDRRALGYGSWLLSLISVAEGNFQDALAHAETCLANALPNTSDDKVGETFRAICLIRLGQFERGMAALRQCEAEAHRKSDIALLHGIRFGRGIGELMQGYIVEGLRTLQANSIDVQSRDNLLNRYVDKLYRAAMLLSIGFDRAGQATPNKLRLRDLILVLGIKPFALSWAEKLLKQCEGCPLWQSGGVFQAQVQLGLGRLYRARGKTGLARQCLQAAKRHAEAEGALAIAGRVDRVLADLDRRK